MEGLSRWLQLFPHDLGDFSLRERFRAALPRPIYRVRALKRSILSMELRSCCPYRISSAQESSEDRGRSPGGPEPVRFTGSVMESPAPDSEHPNDNLRTVAAHPRSSRPMNPPWVPYTSYELDR